MRVLVAGVGNVLRGDDGFGVEVAQRLVQEETPEGVRIIETGIGGIHLVQELMDRFDALVVVDAVDLGRAPGTVLVLTPDVRDVWEMSLSERRDQLADMHYAVPERALMLAKALKVLPPRVAIVGCQPVDAEGWGEGLSPQLERAIPVAIEEVKRFVAELGIAWDDRERA